MNRTQVFTQRIDACFSPAIFHRFTEDDRVKARVIFSVLVFSSLSVAIASFVMLCLSLLLVRNMWVGVLFSAAVALGMGISALAFSKNGRILIVANVFAILMFSSIGTAFMFTGGIHSPVAFLLLAVPVSIFMAAGRKSGQLWSLLTLIFYLLIFYLDQRGVDFVQIMRSQNRDMVTTFMWYLSCVIIIGFLALYERIVGGLTEAIRDEKLKYSDEAIYDELTGFFNRQAFQDKFEEALHGVTLSGGRLALLRVDIINLTQIIGQCGYEAGDELVKKISTLSMQAVDQQGICGRFGSAELCILIPSVQDRGQVISLISRLKKTCGSYIEMADGIKVPVRLSIGGVFAPDYSISSRSLLRGVQDAMVECESLQENFVLR